MEAEPGDGELAVATASRGPGWRWTVAGVVLVGVTVALLLAWTRESAGSQVCDEYSLQAITDLYDVGSNASSGDPTGPSAFRSMLNLAAMGHDAVQAAHEDGDIGLQLVGEGVLMATRRIGDTASLDGGNWEGLEFAVDEFLAWCRENG